MSVGVADTVTWQWSAPKKVSGVGYRVEQVMDAASKTPMDPGFVSSLEKAPSGTDDCTLIHALKNMLK